MVPVQVCKTVCQEVVEKYPVRRCNFVCEQMVQRIPYQVCHTVCEQHTRQVPVVTYHTVQEVHTCKVPICVPTQVPYTVDRCVPRTVCKTIPVCCTRLVSKCVPRQVAYEVCHVVPVTVCNQPECTTCSGTCANGDCGNSSLPPAIDSVAACGVASGSAQTGGTGRDADLRHREAGRPLQTIPPVAAPEEAPKDETPGPKV